MILVSGEESYTRIINRRTNFPNQSFASQRTTSTDVLETKGKLGYCSYKCTEGYQVKNIQINSSVIATKFVQNRKCSH